MIPYEQLRCRPRCDVNMRSLSLARAEELSGGRQSSARAIASAAGAIAGVTGSADVPKARVSEPFAVWAHQWQQLMLEPETGIELPATFVYANKQPAPTILHFDGQHRNRLLCSGGLMARAVNFLEESCDVFGLLSVDLRGYGDTCCAMYPYEMPCWGSTDRYLAYTSAALGDSIMAMRIRDALAALAYVRTRSEVDSKRIVLTGCGLAAIAALHAGAIDGNVLGVVVWDGLFSFKSLLEQENYAWTADVFMPNVLLGYDLLELAAAMPMSVSVLHPLDGAAEAVDAATLEEANTCAGREIYLAQSDQTTITKHIQSLLRGDAQQRF